MAALRAVQALCVRSLGGVSTTPRGCCQYFLTYGAKNCRLVKRHLLPHTYLNGAKIRKIILMFQTIEQ